MRSKPRIGDRVRITGPMDDPDPIPVGHTGTVYWVGKWSSVFDKRCSVRWDGGRDLGLLSSDSFRVL